MKSRIAIVVTIGIICILLTSVIFMQFKTVQEIEESGVTAMREAELREEITTVREKNKELEQSLNETKQSIEEYKGKESDESGTIELLTEDVNKAKLDLGYTRVKGPGLIITLANGEDAINYSDLLFAVNELKFGGAEAISINDNRIVNNSFIANIANNYIVVNGERLISPYVIKVIGDTKYLESVINIKGGLKDTIESENKGFSYIDEQEVIIEPYNNQIEINYGE